MALWSQGRSRQKRESYLPLGLWQEPNFLRLWSGRTVSLLGSQVSLLALPLVAVTMLGATPFQMGLLTAAQSAPSLLIGPIAGAWIDRHRRRPVMLACDAGRGLLFMGIPAGALLGVLRITYLYPLAFLTGALSLGFGVAAESYLPSLVGRERLIEANSKLELSRSAAELAGPAVAGYLVQLLTAPLAIAADACSFLASALAIWRIEHDGETVASNLGTTHLAGHGLWREAYSALDWVMRHRLLRPLIGASGTLAGFNGMLEAVLILYLSRDLGLSASWLGITFSAGGAGFLLGITLAGAAARRWEPRFVLLAGLALVGGSDLLIPLAHGGPKTVLPLLILAQFFFGLGLPIFNVNAVSLRQRETPDHLLGRVAAASRVLTNGLVPLGALLGGATGAWLSARLTLAIAASGELLAIGWILMLPATDQPSNIIETDGEPL